jgi:hypothetical protein
MSKLSAEKRKELQKLAAKPDCEIDMTDIPEIREIPSGAVIGKFWPVTNGQPICLQHGLIHEIRPRNPAVSPRRESQPVQSGAAGGSATVRRSPR